jgi:hypothetical protein
MYSRKTAMTSSGSVASANLPLGLGRFSVHPNNNKSISGLAG